jgi:hypothetical protein
MSFCTRSLAAARSSAVSVSARASTGTTFTISPSTCSAFTSSALSLHDDPRDPHQLITTHGRPSHTGRRPSQPWPTALSKGYMLTSSTPLYASIGVGRVHVPAVGRRHKVKAQMNATVSNKALAGRRRLFLIVHMVLVLDIPRNHLPAAPTKATERERETERQAHTQRYDTIHTYKSHD